MSMIRMVVKKVVLLQRQRCPIKRYEYEIHIKYVFRIVRLPPIFCGRQVVALSIIALLRRPEAHERFIVCGVQFV